MQEARLAGRLQKELKMLQDPPPGVCVWPSNDQSLSRLEAQIQGPEGTVYAKGIFKLQVQIPDRYPFEPPNVKFITPVYHPNIDSGGRICHDILNMPPKGQWKPSLNIGAVLASIRVLMEEPNHDDGLMSDITAEYKHHRTVFDAKARESTNRFAIQTTTLMGARCSRDDHPQIAAPQMIFPKDQSPEIIKSTPERPVLKEVMRMEASNLSIEDPGTSTSSWCDTVPSFVPGKARLNLTAKLSLGKGSTGTLSKSYSSNESVIEPAARNSVTNNMEGERVSQPRASSCQTNQTATQPGEKGPLAQSTWRQTTSGIASQRASELGENSAHSAERETTTGLSSQRASQRGPTERETISCLASQASQREAARKLGRNGFPILHAEKETTSALGDACGMKFSATLSSEEWSRERTGAAPANYNLKGERLKGTFDNAEKTSLIGRHAARPSQKIIDSITISSKENISINKQVSTIGVVKQASTPDKGTKLMLPKAKTLKLSRSQMSLTQRVQPTSRSGMHANELRPAAKEDVILLDSGSDEEDCIRQQRVQLGVKRKARLQGLRSESLDNSQLSSDCV